MENTGSRDGNETVQLYVRDVVSSVVSPVMSLMVGPDSRESSLLHAMLEVI